MPAPKAHISTVSPGLIRPSRKASSKAIGIEALVRGGTLEVGAELNGVAGEGGASEIVIRAAGPRIAFDQTIGHALDGSLPVADLSSRTAPAAMIHQLAASVGGGVQWALSEDALVMGAVLPQA